MSVYSKEKDVYLYQSLQSIKEQTLRPSEVILVEDGPLTDDLYRVIDQFYDMGLRVVKLSKNQGLGIALREGLLHCSHDLVARMDTDDIADTRRFEKQIDFMTRNPEVDVVGSWILESDNDFKSFCSRRTLPLKSQEIIKFAKVRNPLNHMTVVFRKSSVIAAGNYQSFPMFEDYYLWVRMIVNGCKMANMPEYLVNARAGSYMLLRRRGLSYGLTELKFQRKLLTLGFINHVEFVRSVCTKFPLRIVPLFLIRYVYLLVRCFSDIKYKFK